jgi:septum formation protein
VYTAVVLRLPGAWDRSAAPLAVDATTVTFAPLSEDEIQWYLATGEWQGVAGAYRIQGRASAFVTALRGSFSGVMGLPLHTVYSILSALPA